MTETDPQPTDSSDGVDVDVIVIGAGHNGLVTAAYLARAGVRTLLLEARSDVGGTASSETFGGATVNICNCDHITFRTTPVLDELRLGDHGLTYVDIEPAQHSLAWSGGPAWSHSHDLDTTLDSIGRAYPHEVDGYRRYARAAIPAVEMILDAANEPPTAAGLTRLAIRRRFAGAPTIMRWSRRSAADVLRSFFSEDALLGPAVVTGPMVWGISPDSARSGLGALTHAMRHVGNVGRPVGGSGALPRAILAAFSLAGGRLRTSARVQEILCEGSRVRGVRLDDGSEFLAPIVVSACNPHDTFLTWLTRPPPVASALVARWRRIPHDEGYESKIDAIVTEPPTLLALGGSPAATAVVAPDLASIDRGYRLMQQGRILDQPGLLVNVPSLIDPSVAPATRPGHHVFSLEALFTPYSLLGGWPDSSEPQRWLEQFATLCEPGFLDSIVEYRAMTPDVYERDFHLPKGHATSFGGGPLAAFRNPNPELTDYETDVDGLFLTGAATFPGAGVWGASGRNCAAVVLARLDGPARASR